jgi:hypothetical protein
VQRILAALALVLTAASYLAGAQPGDPAGLRLDVVSWHVEGEGTATGDAAETRAGRAEMLFADGTLLHLDADTRARWAAKRTLALDAGRILVTTGTAGWLEATLRDARATLAPGGSYILLVDPAHARLLVSVLAGQAVLEAATGVVTLSARQLAFVSGPMAAPVATAFEPAPWDTFLQWSSARQARLAWAAAGPATPAAAPGSTIPLGAGGVRAGDALSEAPAPSSNDYGWTSCGAGCGGGWYGVPIWVPSYGPGVGRGWWDGKRDPYAPDFAPREDPDFSPRFGPGAGRVDRGGRFRDSRSRLPPPQTAPPALPAVKPPPPAAPPRAVAGSAGALMVPGPGRARTAGATRPAEGKPSPR